MKRETLTRREWLIRMGGLGVLGAVAGKLLASTRGGRSTSLCARCGIVPWCDRPEAVAARRRGDVRIEKGGRDDGPLCDDGRGA
jgi:hypothetical protein